MTQIGRRPIATPVAERKLSEPLIRRHPTSGAWSVGFLQVVHVGTCTQVLCWANGQSAIAANSVAVRTLQGWDDRCLNRGIRPPTNRGH